MNVLLVGCGRMGSALVCGWHGWHRILVFDPMIETLPEGAERVHALDTVNTEDDLVIVLAVKPQMFASIADSLRPLAIRGAPVVSIMAGISLNTLSEVFGSRVVRAMPNKPVAIGNGITVAVAGNGFADEDRATIESLFAPTGEIVWTKNEMQIDAVTAVSGSGPAYFFRFTEALAQAGVEEGLSPTLAMQLARATFCGAAALAHSDSDTLAELRGQVTSPDGTTAAGLEQMDNRGMIDQLAGKIIKAAAARSRMIGMPVTHGNARKEGDSV